MNLEEALNDPKMARVKNPPVKKDHFCLNCKKYHRSLWDCPQLEFDTVHKEFQRMERHENWARDKAARYLQQLQLAHGKIAMLKNEVQKLRKKLRDE